MKCNKESRQEKNVNKSYEKLKLQKCRCDVVTCKLNALHNRHGYLVFHNHSELTTHHPYSINDCYSTL